MSRTWKMPYSWDRRAGNRSEAFKGSATTRWRELAERRHLAGLTTRGTIPKRKLEGRLILAELDSLAGYIAMVYEYLPAEGQARCVALANRLGAIRRHLV